MDKTCEYYDTCGMEYCRYDVECPEYKKKSKPILFNTEMVKAILDGRKTQTRRIIKPQESICNGYSCTGFILDTTANKKEIGCFRFDHEKYLPIFLKPPYAVGDILWVRETWCDMRKDFGNTFNFEIQNGMKYLYKVTDLGEENALIDSCVKRWRPSIHMPREAARLFLKVTDVRVERLQDITAEQVMAEGIRLSCKHDDYVCSAFPCDFKNTYACRDQFKYLWGSTINKQDLDKYGWQANPWVFVISFEKISQDEAVKPFA